MDQAPHPQQPPLAQVQELQELKRRYSIYDTETLRHWLPALTGIHHTAILSLLHDRETPS